MMISSHTLKLQGGTIYVLSILRWVDVRVVSRGSFRYCQRAAHVPIGRPGEVQEGMGGASGSNLMVSLLVVRHSGGGPAH